MCGIIGYIGKDNSVEHLICGLKALEYRGYDSAGVAFFDNSGTLHCTKAAGRLENVEAKLRGAPDSHCGIGHTRWATHGAPTDINSHPHGTACVRLVHNGIIENHAEIKKELIALGYTFESDTDTEAAAKLLDYYYKTLKLSPLDAIRRMTSRLVGSWALGILFSDDPDTLWAARHASPLIIGVGDGENFIASDITAILSDTPNYYRLDDGELAKITSGSVSVYSKNGDAVQKVLHTADWDIDAARRGGFEHYMLKEINDEPQAIKNALGVRIKDGLPDFSADGIDSSLLAGISRVHIVACGTAMHAGLIAKNLLSELAGLPCEVEIASEFRYTPPIFGENELVIVISQSGETADSLAALRLSKQKGAHVLALVNVVGSSIALEADSVIYTMAGPEIAVASTKAYSVQTALLCLFAIEVGIARQNLQACDAAKLTDELLNRAPEAISEIIANDTDIKAAARMLAGCENAFFIGRGIDSHLACEGSLKLKEISYIHSEAYAAGELKHGTISLIVDRVPVVALCTQPRLIEKTVSNILETKARGALTAVICAHEIDTGSGVADHLIRLPQTDTRLAFLPAATATQLLAYYTALYRGCDIDKPRNLAKSVTVE